jgi:nicotinate-nucleotide adenylyltransferase
MNAETQHPISRIGVLGGTFDPPHLGHLAIAQAAMAQLRLQQVLFAPTRQPPHKPLPDITPVERRIEMVQLAIANDPHFTLSRVDVDREGPTYTVDMLRLLHQQLGAGVDLYFIMGMDSLANILTWRDPHEIIRLCWLAVFQRPGFDANLDELEKHLPGLRKRVIMLNSPMLDIAASDLQQRIRAGQSIQHLVPAPVAEYIAKHNLYKDSDA